MTSWPNNPGGGAYHDQQGYPGYPGATPGGYPGYPSAAPGGYPGYPGGAPGGYPGSNQGGYPGGNSGYAPPPPGFAPPYSGDTPAPAFVPPPVHLPTQPGMYGTNDGEDMEIKGFNFSDKTLRHAFIRKVYAILMLQLLITFGVVALFTFSQNAKLFARQNMALFYVCLGVTIVLLISMACCTNVRRKAPMNFIFLFIFTGAEAILLGFTSSMYKEHHVMMAVGITVVIVFALTLFSFQTKFDFTGFGTYLFIGAIVLMLFIPIRMIYHGSTINIIYSAFGALLFSFYLIYDTQLMLGGNHKYSISPEEYIFASLNLYLDIVNIFMYVLSLLNSSSD